MTKRVRTTRRLEVWLKETSVPLFVLNSRRRLVFFNDGCERLTGWTAGELLGQVCDFVTEADTSSAAALLACLSPPSAVWQGMVCSIRSRVACRTHEPVECVIRFLPLTDTTQKVQATLGMIESTSATQPNPAIPITERLHRELSLLRQSLKDQVGDGSLIGGGPIMRRVLGQLKLAQESSLPILFLGEAGTGRKFMARMIHRASSFGQRAFVPLDCRKLPAEFLESTLKRLMDSHRDDAFGTGTVFLDRIDELTRDLQRLVIDLIESKSPTSPRIIAGSLSTLEPLVESEDFLSELAYSLTMIQIAVPPLRNRMEDLEPLAQFFLEETNRGRESQVTGFQPDVLRQFQRYQWPGNVAELKSVVQEAREQCTASLIEPEHLPFRFRTGVSGQSIGRSQRPQAEPLDPLLIRVEREQIELALTQARHNKAKAAELLGITRPRLYRRMEILGIVDNQGDSKDADHQIGEDAP